MDTDKVIQDLNRRFAAPLPDLVIADEQGLQVPQREPFQIDIAFVLDEFDFFS